ncbi:2,3-dihydroxyphenylpropionate 1,2-dioxygenase [Raineyella antarctica]|uniref:2,3-dihydroxyphenylpropionate/2,3-dihydroxicinnamic acid 1,2-dioxygenase n=1 Tax=Raineyella antarctica TaxID=1577474 RepID=A0A1G6I4K2_9ACTN|nr:3-carboxyethylcatechol 2,3-dioxygenase [Raineyella antarctica]SDC01303.1 2,3-dihydroxyphenylpropionate 1,2-dioxygenase [Raineyella antarctica]
MSLSLMCISHSPLMGFNEPAEGVREEVDALFDRARAFVSEVDPTLVVTFGPDHYNGFFYDLMPPFAICYAAHGAGDYDTSADEFVVPEHIAAGLAQYAVDHGIDMTISRGAELDHGAVQIPETVLGGITKYPTVPVFVNGVAEPFVPISRIRLMGQVLGDYLATLDERVLLIGSGGLSHDPPVPRWAEATEAQRAFLLEGRHPTPEARAARQAKTINTGLKFAAGEADIQELNPEWDNAFLDVCESGDVTAFDAYTATQMTLDAGHSSHEVRCWVAACAAMRSAGPYVTRERYYRAIPEWIAGFGAFFATTA